MNLKSKSGKNNLHITSSTEETNQDQQQIANGTESELFEQLQQDEALFERHTNLILSTPGFELLSRQEAESLTETLFRYATLLYEVVITLDEPPLFLE